MVKHTQTIRQLLPTNCLSMFDHFAGLALKGLNNFHHNIQFTYETEYNFKLAFLDVMRCKERENIVVTVCQKVTNLDVNLNWNSSAPHGWKRRGTLRALIQRAYMI